jgi:hypothetical protein
MSSTRFLTKSRFKLAVECPTKLFYTGKPAYEDVMANNEFMAMLAEGGFQVGELSKALYPNGIEVTERNNLKAIAITEELLKSDCITIFEPAIAFGNYLVRVDILVKNGNHFDLIEVKAKSYDSVKSSLRGKRGGIETGMKPYLQDVAFQKWVLQQAIPSASISTFLMMPDKSKIAPIDGINQIFKINQNRSVNVRVPVDTDLKAIAQNILYKLPVDEFTQEILNSPLQFAGGEMPFAEACNTWALAYAEDRKIQPIIGAYCGQCQFKSNENAIRSGFHECWKQANNWTDTDFVKGTVLDLWNSRKKQKFIDSKRLKLTDIKTSDLLKDDEDAEAGINGLTRGQRQALQVGPIPEDYDCGGFYFDKPLYQVTKSEWKYPYHLIDFETSAVALPFYKGMHPYEAVAFQFSHHTLDSNGKVEHIGEFLCVEPGVFPNYEFARALKNDLERDDGSVFMWSHHENTILSTILRQLADDPSPPVDAKELMAFIMSITKGGDREMIDLCKLAEKSFFHSDTKGSNSIKKVLPAILKISPKLRLLYSKPIYGNAKGMSSKNFIDMAWLDANGQGDPYAILKKYAGDLLPAGAKESEEGETSIIADGGAATTAYSRLQFEDINQEGRDRIKEAMLRYCELDTLAMVMVLQGWDEAIQNSNFN